MNVLEYNEKLDLQLQGFEIVAKQPKMFSNVVCHPKWMMNWIIQKDPQQVNVNTGDPPNEASIVNLSQMLHNWL